MNFFQLAERLVVSEPNPAGHRSAISRAYYGAFLTAKKFVDSMGIDLDKSDNSHEKILAVLHAVSDNDIQRVYRLLDNLRRERNQADYQLANPTVEKAETAKLRLQEAASAMGLINTCSLSTARCSTIKTEVIDYATKMRMHIK